MARYTLFFSLNIKQYMKKQTKWGLQFFKWEFLSPRKIKNNNAFKFGILAKLFGLWKVNNSNASSATSFLFKLSLYKFFFFYLKHGISRLLQNSQISIFPGHLRVTFGEAHRGMWVKEQQRLWSERKWVLVKHSCSPAPAVFDEWQG